MADELIEARVRKRFGTRWFLGTVREVWRGGAEDGHAMLAHVAYDDGDAEDLTVEDARALLVAKPEAPEDAEVQAAKPALAPKRKGNLLLTDAFQKLPAKRPAGEIGTSKRCAQRYAAPGRRVRARPKHVFAGKPWRQTAQTCFRADSCRHGFPAPSAGAAAPAARGARAKRTKVSPESEEVVPELTPEEQAAAEAARKAAAAAAAEAAAAAAAAAAEARLVAQERSHSAVAPGSVHVANLCVQFTTAKSAWSGTVPELLAKLGPTPALHTLLRIVTVDTTRCCTAQEQAEEAAKLRRDLRDIPSCSRWFFSMVQSLRDHLLENSKSFNAAFDAAASPDDAEAEDARMFAPGDLVCYVGADPTPENPHYGVLNSTQSTRRIGVVVSVDDQNAIKVSGPVNKDGKPLAGYEGSQYNSFYGPEQLALERERRKRVMGAVLSSWDVSDVSQYRDKAVKTGTTRKHAYAEVLRHKMHVTGPDGISYEANSDDPSLQQTLAVQLYDRAWGLSYKNAPEHAMGVVVSNLRADSGVSGYFLADLQLWLPPTDLFCHIEGGNNFLGVRIYGSPTFGNWLMRFGKHLVEPMRALESAESKAPPSTGAELLALAEKNPFSHSVAAPAALSVALKPYQRCSLAWMLAEEAGEGMLRHIWHPVTLPCATAQGTRQRRLFYSPLLSSFREQQPERVCGGWLAEAMGLGKTIVTLSLILADHDSTVTSPVALSADATARIAVADAAFARRVAAAKLVKTNATLVVAPLSLIAQWESEIKLKCGALPSGKPLRVARWYGETRIRDPARLASEFDVVLTTYETLAWSHNFREGSERYKKYCTDTTARQAAASAKAVANGQDPPKEKALQTSQRATLEEIAWRRIVCDESQAMKDALVARSEACASLLSQRRWLLSGTPVSTQASDLAGQLMALQLDDLQQPKTLFNSLFDTPFREGRKLEKHCTATGVDVYAGAGAMRLLVPLLLMRHTKDMTVGGEKVLTLPPKTESTVVITLSPTERAAYNAVELEMRTRWRELCQLGIDGVSKHMLLAMSMLQPMQRMCSGGAISPSRDLASKTSAKRPWEKQMRAPPLLGAQGAARLENDPAGESCCVCSLEPEDGVRTKCCGVCVPPNWISRPVCVC
jgi:hypothetical protein